jgi:hypothetical protein
LSGANSNQLTALATDFAAASVVNVTDDNGVIWSSGMSSVLSIYGDVQLAVAGGATWVNFFDASNLSHAVTIKRETAAITVAGVQVITWS